jgi:predicted RNA-binding protein associated with RNAse of E/G family
VELDDIDELLTAVRHGLLSPEIGEQAVRSALDAVERSVPPRLRPALLAFWQRLGPHLARA